MRLAIALALASGVDALALTAGRSRLFLDSASRADWNELLPTGLFYGVTTNPTILERDGVACTAAAVAALATDALDAGCHQVMVQAWGGTADAYEKRALQLLDAVGAADHLVIKLPLTREGIVAATRLRDDAHICLTACYAKEQVLVANALKADYLAPYLGRMSDMGVDGTAECLKMQAALDSCRSPTRLLAASLRTAGAVFDVVAAGADATFSAEVARSILDVQPTIAASLAFEDAAMASQAASLEAQFLAEAEGAPQ